MNTYIVSYRERGNLYGAPVVCVRAYSENMWKALQNADETGIRQDAYTSLTWYSIENVATGKRVTLEDVRYGNIELWKVR